MNSNSKIYVAGHRGMVGSAIWRALEAAGYTNLVGRSSRELDLRNQQAVDDFFEAEKPEYVFLAAAKVGGIQANNVYRAEFLYDNLQIQNNIIHSAWKHGVTKLLFLGSSCIYPKMAPQPLKECDAYRAQYGCNYVSVMPTNLYGPNDNYDLNNSHVLPALIRKFHEAKVSGAPTVTLWGTGKPRREFLHVDDLADACVFLMHSYHEEGLVNIGTGEDIEIGALAELVSRIVGYEGEIVQDLSKPDGTPRKLMDVSKLHGLGWKHAIDLESGIKSVYEEYKAR